MAGLVRWLGTVSWWRQLLWWATGAALAVVAISPWLVWELNLSGWSVYGNDGARVAGQQWQVLMVVPAMWFGCWALARRRATATVWLIVSAAAGTAAVGLELASDAEQWPAAGAGLAMVGYPLLLVCALGLAVGLAVEWLADPARSGRPGPVAAGPRQRWRTAGAAATAAMLVALLSWYGSRWAAGTRLTGQPDPFRLVQLGSSGAGRAAWQLRAPLRPIGASSLDVAAVDGLVITGKPGSASTVTARDLRTGAVRWRVGHAAWLGGMWLSGDSRTLVVLYWVREVPVAVGLDPRTGRQRWQRMLSAGPTTYLPAGQAPGSGDGNRDGVNLNPNTDPRDPSESSVDGLDPATGSTVLRLGAPPGTVQSIATSASLTAAMQFSRDAYRGAVSLYAASGSRRWTHPAGGRLQGNFFSSWVDAVTATAVLVQWTYASPHTFGRTVLQALDPATGAPLWTRPIGYVEDDTLLAADGTHILLRNTAGTIDLLDTATGARQASWRMHVTAGALTASHAYLYAPATAHAAPAVNTIDLRTGRRTRQPLPADSAAPNSSKAYPSQLAVTVAQGRIVLASYNEHTNVLTVIPLGTR